LPAGFADGLNTTLLVASGTALADEILVLVLVRKHAAAPVAAQSRNRRNLRPNGKGARPRAWGAPSATLLTGAISGISSDLRAKGVGHGMLTGKRGAPYG